MNACNAECEPPVIRRVGSRLALTNVEPLVQESNAASSKDTAPGTAIPATPERHIDAPKKFTALEAAKHVQEAMEARKDNQAQQAASRPTSGQAAKSEAKSTAVKAKAKGKASTNKAKDKAKVVHTKGKASTNKAKDKAKVVHKAPHFSDESSRSQFMARTGLPGPGQTQAFKYSSSSSKDKARKLAEKWVSQQKRQQGCA